ncbi:MAG TPA: TlpA disulfide reductase family protein [Steroidobacteraceae bacterium]|nr:TlpA disulfide reductase family protein [Steroidobacteraceae bacterium]
MLLKNGSRTSWLRGLVAGLLLAAAAIAGGSASKPAPNFTLANRAGGQMSLAKLKGQVVMINFWASWCGPCRQEMPLLDQMYKKYKPLGFTLVGVNVEPDSTDAEGYLRKTPVTYPILLDKENKVSSLYEVSAMPSSVIVDRKGRVRYVHHGYKPGDENEFLNQIRTLVKE